MHVAKRTDARAASLSNMSVAEGEPYYPQTYQHMINSSLPVASAENVSPESSEGRDKKKRVFEERSSPEEEEEEEAPPPHFLETENSEQPQVNEDPCTSCRRAKVPCVPFIEHMKARGNACLRCRKSKHRCSLVPIEPKATKPTKDQQVSERPVKKVRLEETSSLDAQPVVPAATAQVVDAEPVLTRETPALAESTVPVSNASPISSGGKPVQEQCCEAGPSNHVVHSAQRSPPAGTSTSKSKSRLAFDRAKVLRTATAILSELSIDLQNLGEEVVAVTQHVDSVFAQIQSLLGPGSFELATQRET